MQVLSDKLTIMPILPLMLIFWAVLAFSGDTSGAVVVTTIGAPVHLAGTPGGAFGLGPGGRVLDVDADGQPDLGIYESTVCTTDVPTSSCQATITIRGLNGTNMAWTGTNLILPGASVGPVITDALGVTLGTYSVFLTAPISRLDRKLRPPVSSTPRNPFGESVLDGLVAFRMPGEGGTSHFGFLHLAYREWPAHHDSSLFQASSPIVQGWAYEAAADTPIEARLIPEPGGMILGVVLAACLGLRRRRPGGA